MTGVEDYFPAEQKFEMGWRDVRRNANVYWSPSTKDWPVLDAATVTQITGGKYMEPGRVEVDLSDPTPPWVSVEASWQIAKAHHPNAVWSPRDGWWYDHHEAGGGTVKPPLTPAAKALLQRLEEIERMPGLDAVTRQQLHNQALRAYGEQLSAPPP